MIRYFATHPTAANALMATVILLGLTVLPKLQRDTFPVIPTTEVEIRVPYPGATPEEVEDAICQRIEDALDSVADLAELRCDARENLAIATAEMRESADMVAFFNDVKSQVESISTFPAKAETPAIVKLERTAVVASIAITGDMTATDLKAFAETVRERIKRDPRIAQVRLLGFSALDIEIEVPAAALRRYGLAVSDLASAIERQSVDLPAGIMETGQGDLIVRFADQRRTPGQFRNLVVASGESGGRVRLGDIARVRTRFESPEERILFNGARAAMLEISKTTAQDSLRVMDAIRENLAREQGMAPRGVSLQISQDVTSNIRDRLRILIGNGLQGLLLVFLTLWLFFGLRFSFWVAMGLPVSFLGAAFVMHTLGYTLNMMTLVGLLVAIGLLMDDAIVISENVAAKIRQGRSALAAAVEGTRQVLPGVLSSFVTTIIVIGPLAFLSGRMGAVLKFLPAVLLITLAVSLLEAILILPAHLLHAATVAGSIGRSRFRTWFDRGFDRVRDSVFGPLVNRAIATPYLALGLMLALALGSYAAFPAGLLKYRAFPELESDVIQARILLPQGTPLSRTEAVVERVVDSLGTLDAEFSARQRSGERLVKNVSVLFNSNVDAFESGPHLATVSVDLLRAEDRVATVDEMLDRWRDLVGELPDIVALRFTDRERGVAGKAIDIRLQGANLARTKQASLELQAWLRRFEGVQDVSDDLRPGKPELRVRLREAAGSLGVDARIVADEVRVALRGATDIDVQVGRESRDVTVRLLAADLDSLSDLRYLAVPARDGRLVPLSAIATVAQTRGFARIHRVNAQRTVTVQGTLDTRVANARELMGATKKKFLQELKERHPGVEVSLQGQGKESALTGTSLRNNLGISLIGIFLVLLFQFRSYVQPVAVLLAIPMGLIGAVWGHVALGLDFTMPSFIGLAALAGVVVNDNILLVAFIRNSVGAGMAASDAARLAARDRFRAIVLTSLTTVVGLLPLLMERSTQAQFLIPIAASLAFGLLTATVMSLFLVPVCFVIMADLDLLKTESPAGDPAAGSGVA